jgi:hypothetical protein
LKIINDFQKINENNVEDGKNCKTINTPKPQNNKNIILEKYKF